MTKSDTHIPVITGNYSPFRLVLRDGYDQWAPTLDEINDRTYDYVKLHRGSTFLDVGIAPFSMLVCFDGTLALPALERFRDPGAVLTLFNKVLCELLIGGVYCEAMSPDDVNFGEMTTTAYCKMRGAARGNSAGLHNALRTKHVGALDSIRLHKPQTIAVSELHKALSSGRKSLSSIGLLTPETLLYGATFFARKQWAESLIHLWTSVEQVVESIWQEKIVNGRTVEGSSKKKRVAFLNDHRTWAVSARLELIYQSNILPDQTYVLLDTARKARNEFAHRGVKPTENDAEAALEGLSQLCSLRMTHYADVTKLIDIFQVIKSQNKISQGEVIEASEVEMWLPLPSLPGDDTWGDKPIEIIDELQLQPLPEEVIKKNKRE